MHAGTVPPLATALQYSPPEVVTAYEERAPVATATSHDIWALCREGERAEALAAVAAAADRGGVCVARAGRAADGGGAAGAAGRAVQRGRLVSVHRVHCCVGPHILV